MALQTVISAREFDLGTGNVACAFRSPTAGSKGGLISISRIVVFQNGSTTLEMCSIEVATRDTAGTLTLTSTTPAVVEPLNGDVSGLSGNTAPAGGAARSGTNSSADSGGSYTNVFYEDFANLNGWLWKPDPNEEIIVPSDTVFIVRFAAAPSSTADWGINMWLRER